jgi:hypothetical protein
MTRTHDKDMGGNGMGLPNRYADTAHNVCKPLPREIHRLCGLIDLICSTLRLIAGWWAGAVSPFAAVELDVSSSGYIPGETSGNLGI